MLKSFVVAAVLTVTLLGTAGILYSDMPEPNGLPNISGTWVGKAKVKAFDMTGQDEGGKEKALLVVKVAQKGNGFEMRIYPEDGDPIDLMGQIGDGHFWAYGEDDGPILMVGHVKNKEKKIVGKLLAGEGDMCIEVSVQLKRPKITMDR